MLKSKNTLTKGKILCLIIFTFYIQKVSAQEEQTAEKHHEDPTKIIAKFGLGYADDLTISGSIGLDNTKKINGSINSDLSEWRLGGSWLYDVGIINFNLGRREYDDGGYKNNYSVGTFAPLSKLGVDTGKWMIFITGGFTHNTGEIKVSEEPVVLNNGVLVNNSNNSGYVGSFALRPINDQWTMMMFVGFSRGSSDYKGSWAGAGVSYKIDKNQAINLFGFSSDDNFGQVQRLSVSYLYEFK